MKKTFLIAICGIVAVSSCTSPVTKKVVVLSRGDISAKENEIQIKEGTGHSEKTVEIRGDKPVTWNVETPQGKTTINIPQEPGVYVLNLKTDTIVGSEQNLNNDLGGRTITQEELKVRIDSLTKLTTGANASAANRNYFILPKQLIKLSPNISAKVYGPFTKIPGSIEADENGKAPEIFKFYTNNEMRELIAKLKKQTI